MENFHKLKTLDAYLDGIEEITGYKDYLENFLTHINAIPNVEELFRSIAKDNPKWISLADSTQPQAYIDVIKLNADIALPDDELSLCIFDAGKLPVIKITTYIHK